jgi:hypothetical protein
MARVMVPDLTGRHFGRLTVTAAYRRNSHRHTEWRCVCHCGTETWARLSDLRTGHTQSCGCFARERSTTHGHKRGGTASPTYISWNDMITRCTCVTTGNYAAYGGRGITVCDRWQRFENFLADMGERPAGRSIDRINNAENYEPLNCRWATPKEQRANQRRAE